jgi:hypothetical protein
MRKCVDADSSLGRLLLAAPDTLHFSADIQLGDELHEKLEREKLAAQEAEHNNRECILHSLSAQYGSLHFAWVGVVIGAKVLTS